MDIEDFISAGSAVFDEVRDSVNQGNYQGLSGRIMDRVTEEIPGLAGRKVSAPKKIKNYFLTKRVNRQSGTGRMILGGILGAFGSIFTLLAIADLVLSLTVLGSGVGTALGLYLLIVFGGLTAGSAALFLNGKRTRDLARLYYEYGAHLEGKEYFMIEQLADRLGISRDLLTRNLEGMKKNGMLPMARMDSQKTTVMLTDHAYEQYRLAEQSRQEREAQEEQGYKERGSATQNPDSQTMPDDITSLLREGQAYISHLKEVNRQIPDEDPFSEKLYRQELIVSRIFEQVEKQPESAHNLRRFMDYYLPTTQKLIDAYADLYRQPEVGDHITNTKAEISDAIDMVNKAFENLLNSMFQDVAWDISSDISVMKTMLSQDGLTDDKERSSHE